MLHSFRRPCAVPACAFGASRALTKRNGRNSERIAAELTGITRARLFCCAAYKGVGAMRVLVKLSVALLAAWVAAAIGPAEAARGCYSKCPPKRVVKPAPCYQPCHKRIVKPRPVTPVCYKCYKRVVTPA